MTDDARGYLLRQFETAWKLTSYHLDGLTTDAASPVMFAGTTSHEDVRLPAVTGKLALRDSLLQVARAIDDCTRTRRHRCEHHRIR